MTEESRRKRGRSQGTKQKLFLLGCGQLSSCPNPGDVLDAPSVTVFAFSILRLPASRVRDNASVALPSECPAAWNLHSLLNCVQAWCKKTYILLSRFCVNFKESFKDSQAQIILSAQNYGEGREVIMGKLTFLQQLQSLWVGFIWLNIDASI